jgi:hypothetical protein
VSELESIVELVTKKGILEEQDEEDYTTGVLASYVHKVLENTKYAHSADVNVALPIQHERSNVYDINTSE